MEQKIIELMEELAVEIEGLKKERAYLDFSGVLFADLYFKDRIESLEKICDKLEEILYDSFQNLTTKQIKAHKRMIEEFAEMIKKDQEPYLQTR